MPSRHVVPDLDGLARRARSKIGAGLMSLNASVNLPVQRARLDTNLLKDVENEAILRSVIGLGHNLNLTVAADSIQSDADLARVRQFGCHDA